jgi:hypothetical protein
MLGRLASATAVVLVCACSQSAPPASAKVDPPRRVEPGVHRPIDPSLDGAPPMSSDGGVASCTPTLTNYPVFQWAPPAPLHVAACNLQQVGFIAQMNAYTDYTAQQNQQWDAFTQDANNATCLQCAITPANQSPRGPLYLDNDGYAYPFCGGCVASFTNDIGPNGCGARMFALEQCEWQLCYHCADDDAGWSACVDAADKTSCAQYTDALQCSAAVLGRCYGAQNETNEQVIYRLLQLFCTNT